MATASQFALSIKYDINDKELVSKIRADIKLVESLDAALRKIPTAMRNITASATQTQGPQKVIEHLRNVQNEAKKTATSINSIATATGKMGAKVAQQNRSLFGVGTGVQGGMMGGMGNIGRYLVGGSMGYAAYRVGRAMVTDALKTEQLMAYNRTLGVTDSQSRSVLALGNRYNINRQDLLMASYQAASSEVPAADLGGFMKAAAVLASSTPDKNAEEMSMLLAAIENSYAENEKRAKDFSGGNMMKYADMLAATAQYGIVQLPQLAQQLGDILPLSSAAGVPLEEVLGAYVSITRKGVNPAETATALVNLMRQIIKPSEGAQEASKALGFDLSAKSLREKGFADFFAELSKKIGAASGDEIEKWSQVFPEIRALRGALGAGFNAEETRRNIGLVANSSGKAEEMQTIAQDNLIDSAGKAKNAFLDLVTTVIEATGGLGGISEQLDKSSTAFDNLTEGLTRRNLNAYYASKPAEGTFAAALGMSVDPFSQQADQVLAQSPWTMLSFKDQKRQFREMGLSESDAEARALVEMRKFSDMDPAVLDILDQRAAALKLSQSYTNAGTPEFRTWMRDQMLSGSRAQDGGDEFWKTFNTVTDSPATMKELTNKYTALPYEQQESLSKAQLMSMAIGAQNNPAAPKTLNLEEMTKAFDDGAAVQTEAAKAVVQIWKDGANLVRETIASAVPGGGGGGNTSKGGGGLMGLALDYLRR